jgi:phospholipid/cholesterol/gamma-HCH transport system substrate-binding protein
MENKSHALAAGLFILALTAMLISAAMWLTRDTSALAIFELAGNVNVAGLQPQATVRLRGVAVGKVQDIRLDPTTPGQVLVGIAVDAQAPISSATQASLGYQGVTGLAFIALEDAGAPGTPLTQGSRIPLKPGLMGRLTDQGERILAQLEIAGTRINQLLSPDNQQVLMTTVRQFGQTATELQQLTRQANQAWPELAQTGRDTLASMKSTSIDVGRSADEARASAYAFRLVTERMYAPGGTLDRMDQGADILVATGTSLRISTLPRVDQAVLEAAHTTHQLGELTQTLSDNPQALLLGKPVAPPGPGEPGFAAPVRAGQ